MRRTFRSNIGQIIFQTNGKASRHEFDTCDCIIIYDENINHLFTQQKCKLHTNINDTALLTAVLAHNRSFNLANGRNATAAQVIQQSHAKEDERNRIRALP